MNIFVCIKQVPSTNKVEVDEKTGVLKRDGVASKMNPYDLYALETALRLKEKHGGKLRWEPWDRRRHRPWYGKPT